MHQHQRIVPPRHIEIPRQGIQQLSRSCKLTREQKLPVVSLLHHRVQIRPSVRSQKRWDLDCRLNLHQAFRNDHQLPMLPGDVEMMHMVRQVVPIAEHPAPRTHRKMELKTALLLIAARVHARLHHAFAHRTVIQEFRQMPNRIKHPILQVPVSSVLID